MLSIHSTANNLYPVPSWVYESVIYQIFPDRFAIGKGKTVKDKAELYTKRGGRIVEWSVPPKRKDKAEHVKDFYGGDLWGIAEKLDYLKDLGVNVIYTNPIFLSPTNHKYDAIDYMKVDPQFGGEKAFKYYVKKAKSENFRLILDGVFNHLSSENLWFKKALRGDRKHVSKFAIYEDGHRAWYGHKSLPEWHLEEVEVMNYILSVVKHYLIQGIDGWRLDVGFDLGYVNNALITKAAKQVSIEKYVVTETWNYPSNWHMVDGIMNYHFRNTVIAYLKGEFDNLADALQSAYNDTPNIHGCWNMLDSHDTERLATVIPDKALRKLAIVLQFTYPGVPVVYYGTEIGIEGGGDPECRATMKWNEEEWDKELREFYKKLITIRKSETALKIGTFEVLNKEPLVFYRRTPHILDGMIVAINKGEKKSVTVSVPDGRLLAGTCFTDLITGEEFWITAGVMRIDIPAKGFRLLRVTNKTKDGYNMYKRIY